MSTAKKHRAATDTKKGRPAQLRPNWCHPIETEGTTQGAQQGSEGAPDAWLEVYAPMRKGRIAEQKSQAEKPPFTRYFVPMLAPPKYSFLITTGTASRTVWQRDLFSS